MNGNFVADYDPAQTPILSIDAYPVAEQPDTLDCAALTFCLGGPFHPGCEITWTMRVASMYRGKFRLRRHPDGFTDPDYGDFLNQVTVLGDSGPLSGSGAGDLTKWMSVPWQADTASCLHGYPVFETPQGGPFNVDRLPAHLLGAARAQRGAYRRRLPDRDGHHKAAGGPDRGLQPPPRVDPQPLHDVHTLD